MTVMETNESEDTLRKEGIDGNDMYVLLLFAKLGEFFIQWREGRFVHDSIVFLYFFF